MTKYYVELNRKFIEFKEEEDKPPIDYSRFLRGHSEYLWIGLLQDYNYLVILGEAGTGKTKEFENRARILAEDNEYAFFCTIESLATETNFRNILRNSEEQELFDNWLNSNAQGYFFLDSVDEAKLREKSFENALHHLSISLTTKNVLRSKIIISCRVSDWKFRFDKETFEKIIPSEKTESVNNKNDQTLSQIDENNLNLKSTSQTDQLKVNVFSISPLEKNQVKILAEFYGVKKYNDFISAIEEDDYWHLCERPQDVEWLSNYWQNNNKLGRYSELIEYNIDKKIEDVNKPKSGEVTKEKLRIGVEILAAAITLSKKSFISLPDEYRHKTSLPDSINPEEVLFDWKPNDIENLLRRGIFDEATFGRVKFHHRVVIEYLVALWIKRLIEKKCPQHQINNFLFGTAFGFEAIKHSMKPTIAWLSLFSDDIKQKVVKYYPEILISFGDPASLNKEIKKRILINFCKKYEKSQRIGIEFERISLKRFVSPSLEETVLFLLQKYSQVRHIKLLLIRLCREGRYKKTAPKLFEILKDKKEDASIRGVALNAIVGIGDILAISDIKEYILNNAESLPYNLAGECIEICYPQYFSINELITFIKKSEPNWNESWRSVPQVLYDICEHNWFNISDEKLEELLEGLVGLINERLSSTDKSEQFRTININYREISGAISSLLRKKLALKSENQVKIDVIADAVKILNVFHKHFGDHLLEKEKIKELISKFPKLKRELFYRKISREQDKGVEVKYLINLQFFFNDFWYLNQLDLDWLIKDLQSQEDDVNKHIILDSILFTLRDYKPIKSEYEKIKSIINSDVDLMEHYMNFMNPPKPKKDKFIAKIERDEKKIKNEQEILMAENKKYLLEHLDSISKGKEIRALHHLVQVMAENRSSNSWGQSNLKAVKDKYGIEVMNAARDGLITFWRTWSPPLPHELEERNKTEYGVIIGLSGLSIEFSEGINANVYSEEEAELATRYAIRELNNFPSWLKDIATKFPDIVEKIIGLCVDVEFNTPAEKPVPHEVLSTLVHSDILLKELLSPKCFELLKIKTPAHKINISYALSIILESSLKNHEGVKRLIQNRIRAVKDDIDMFIIWFDSWLNVDLANAVPYLEKILRRLNTEKSSELMLNLCGELSRSRYLSYLISFDLNRIEQVQPLAKFLGLVYKHIKPEEDNIHFGGYTPDIRDDAQSFRGRLLDRLLSIPGVEAYNAIINLSKELASSSSKDVFQYLARDKAEKEEEARIWEPKEVSQFYLKFDKDLVSNEELLDYTFEKITEIKDFIETGELSSRGLFNAETKEVQFQKWIADRFKLISRSDLTVAREEEVDNFKKPDLRIRYNNLVIGIEIKIVEKYSIKELIKAIKDQLISSYLRDINSKYGIFLLANVTSKNWIHPETGKKQNIYQLTKFLNKNAEKINAKNGQGKKVEVININFGGNL